MKTWKQITSDKDFEPQFVELTIPSRFDNSHTEIITAMIIEERINKKSIPGKWIPYEVRHADGDFETMATIEDSVSVNFYGTILVSNLIDFQNKDYVEILDYGFIDWEDVAEDELGAAGISLQYIDHWENLCTIEENLIRCRRAQFVDELELGKTVYVVTEQDEPIGYFKVTQFTGEGPCIDGKVGLGLTPYILKDDQIGELPDEVPLDWLYPVLPQGQERFCPHCHGELLPEIHDTEMDYSWYCPNCQENMFNFEIQEPCQE